MEKLIFDSGVKEFQINGSGVLRFNPSDPNVFDRFMQATEKLQAAEAELVEACKQLPEGDNGGAVVRLLAEADKKTKDILDWVFGGENDFDEILGGVNLMAVAGNGERVVTNLLDALGPILIDGAAKCATQKTNAAVAQAKLNRAQRRARK